MDDDEIKRMLISIDAHISQVEVLVISTFEAIKELSGETIKEIEFVERTPNYAHKPGEWIKVNSPRSTPTCCTTKYTDGNKKVANNEQQFREVFNEGEEK